eukprot:scaffold388_cov111-Isochrysis_galbana.AAC.6
MCNAHNVGCTALRHCALCNCTIGYASYYCTCEPLASGCCSFPAGDVASTTSSPMPATDTSMSRTARPYSAPCFSPHMGEHHWVHRQMLPPTVMQETETDGAETDCEIPK